MAIAETMLVSEAQRAQYMDKGYFVTDVLFDEATLAEVREAFLQIWQGQIDALHEADEATVYRVRHRPFIARLHEVSEVCDAFCRHEIFMQLAREMVGTDIDMTWNQTIIKPPAPVDNTFAWHQDMWYATHGEYAKDCNLEILNAPFTGITVWVAVTRTIVDNGTLWVIPGGHKNGLLPHVWSDEGQEWQGQFDTSWKIPAVMEAGQMLVFNKYLPHGSGPNVSQEMRMAYQIGYGIPGLKLRPDPDIVPVMRDGVGVRV